MYPIFRLVKETVLARRAPPLDLFDTHVSHHICWPWDLDVWMELNNGRTLTLYDMGRIPLAQRTGLLRLMARNGWGLAMAGATVRYRRRVRAFDRIEMHSRLIGWDTRFLYLEQGMWKSGGDCASHAVYRGAVTDRNGIVPTRRVLQAMGTDRPSPDLPDWVKRWLESEALRPWPPMQPQDAPTTKTA